MTDGWKLPLKLHELARGPVRLQLAPEEAERRAAAKQLKLVSLPALTADVTVKPWLDGVAIDGRFEAIVEQVCGVSLDSFEQAVAGEIHAKAVPRGSPHAASADGGEVELDPDSDDPPDVLAGDSVDVAAYVLEHLALELDPFPRKPGATFDYQPAEEEASPFAALRNLRTPKP